MISYVILMNLSTRQLQAFLQVARIGNITRAAEQTHMTQAGLSILLREMEKQLDCRLFDRTTRMVSLTDAGRRLLPVAERVVAELGAVAAELGDASRRTRRTLRIAATPLVSSNMLPKVFSMFSAAHPDVSLKLFDADLASVEKLVHAGDADLGLGFFFRQTPGIVRVPVGKFRLMRVSPAGTAAPGTMGTVPWSALKQMPLIGLPATNPIQQLIETELSKIGRGHEDRPTFNFFETLISMVAAGYGTTVIPTFAMVACRRHRVATDLLVKPAVTLDFYQVAKRGTQHSAAAADFRRVLMDALPALIA
jgi:DNA-binding transcriptional LysR family regulator